MERLVQTLHEDGKEGGRTLASHLRTHARYSACQGIKVPAKRNLRAQVDLYCSARG
jgi:hypothetical protein